MSRCTSAALSWAFSYLIFFDLGFFFVTVDGILLFRRDCSFCGFRFVRSVVLPRNLFKSLFPTSIYNVSVSNDPSNSSISLISSIGANSKHNDYG